MQRGMASAPKVMLVEAQWVMATEVGRSMPMQRGMVMGTWMERPDVSTQAGVNLLAPLAPSYRDTHTESHIETRNLTRMWFWRCCMQCTAACNELQYLSTVIHSIACGEQWCIAKAQQGTTRHCISRFGMGRVGVRWYPGGEKAAALCTVWWRAVPLYLAMPAHRHARWCPAKTPSGSGCHRTG